ncbi:peptidoglycan DD-metalloendopeptidase family protein [Bartonella sp. B35(2025)]
MYLKVLGNIFRCNFQGVALGVMATVFTGCSAGTQRFASIFPDSTVSTQSNTSTVMPYNPRMLSYGGMIQSTELPPMESSNDSWAYDNNVPHNSPRQGEDFSSNGRIIGVPPRNLGTLSRSQMDNATIFQKNSYIVQSGDTLLSIAQQIGISVNALKLANGISGNSIYIGQILKIPSKRTAMNLSTQNNDQFLSTTESSFQSQSKSSMKYKKDPPVYKAPVKTIPSTKIDKSNIKQNFSRKVTKSDHETGLLDTDNIVTPQSTGISKMRWPIRGRLLSQFGQKKGTTINRGIDIAAPEGSSVKAAENGVVIYASDGLKALGNVVMIRHENDIITIYGYNSKLVVDKGQRVRRGDEIAKSGISGDVKTPRVYFEVRKNSIPVDPIKYLEN